jgi:chemotaxis signal transduction protein
MDVGLLVDDVESIVGYRDEELLAIPSFNAEWPQLFTGCIGRDGVPDIILIDESALLSDASVADLTQGHRPLYAIESAADRGQGKRRRGVRETYVTFKLDQRMGMRIDQLREVIDFPPDVMQPPGAPDDVRGMLNLRRKLIAIIDLRALCGMKGRCRSASCAGAGGGKRSRDGYFFCVRPDASHQPNLTLHQRMNLRRRCAPFCERIHPSCIVANHIMAPPWKRAPGGAPDPRRYPLESSHEEDLVRTDAWRSDGLHHRCSRTVSVRRPP